MSEDPRPVRLASRVEIGLALMALTSIAILLIPSDRLRTTLEFDPRAYASELLDDGFSGGNSQVSWLDSDSHRWQCELGRASSSPYCSLKLDVTDAEGVGLDLSRYDTMTVWADYGIGTRHLRLYLRNRHPNYYRPENDMTTKYNMVELSVDGLPTGLELRMEDFTVAGWWLIQREVPIAYSQPEFNEVAFIEIQTGSNMRTGTQEIQLQKIVWSGPWISQAALYQGVIIAWAVIIFGLMFYRVLNMRGELYKQRQYQAELLAVNSSLNLENRRYEDMAKTDALTGLYNRVGIRDTLHLGLRNWRSGGTPLSFVMIDLDHFKQVNDTHGHDVGDKILREAAKLMLKQVRRTDALARWGGEEFVLVCPETSLEQAQQAAENLRAELERSLRHQGAPITASFGVATMTEPNLDHLFKKADTALYQAKRLGRNRVCNELYEERDIA